MVTATCIECDEEIEINDRLRRGLRVICPNCGAQLEVTNTTPPELDLPIDEDEWDDDEEFDTVDDELDDEWENDDLDDFDDDDDDWEDGDSDDWN